MNKDTILSVLRQILTAVGAFVAGKFGVDGDTMLQIVGGIVALASAIWAAIEASKKSATVEAAKTVLATAETPVSENAIARAAATVQK